MRASRFVVVAASALAVSVTGLNAQSVISAHSGVLHYYEGDVTIEGQPPHQKPGTFAEVKEKQELQTQVGRAEILLTPGAFLRVGENSGFRMVSNKLSDTRIDFLKGSVIADFVEVTPNNLVTMNYEDYKVTFVKKGIYRFDSEPAAFKVYTGEATVSHGTSSVTLKDGRAVPFTPALVSEKFDNRTGDALYRWAKRRSEYIAVANLSAARRAGSGFNSGSSGWYYNPYYSMFTFIPGSGYMCDPFAMFTPGFRPSFFNCYYSPGYAYNYFNPGYYRGYGGGRGYSGGGGSSSAYNSSGYYPTSIGTSSTLSTYSNNSSYSAGPSVSSSSSSSSSSSGFSGSGGSHSSGFSGGSGGGGGGGGSHGGGSGGGHGK